MAGMKQQTVYTVSQINRYVKNMFAQDYLLRLLSVSGEVSNCKYHTSGHIYFSLKDEGSTLSCVLFAGQRKGLGFRMKDGDRVIVRGSVEVYERDGRYQMYAREISLEGEGFLYARFLELKKELEGMGMFDPSYKQPIPRFIHTLGVVTAPTGAAIQDIRTVSLRRNPFLQIVLFPAQVQGESAAQSIVKGIQVLDDFGVDVIIVGRGGGSIEDLWAFNEETVARAIFSCRTPVISAVGHETDFTIADFTADLRAPTPSAAAELAVDDMMSVLSRLDGLSRRFGAGMENKLLTAQRACQALAGRLRLLSPQAKLNEKRQRLDQLQEGFDACLGRNLKENKERLFRQQDHLFHHMQTLLSRKKQQRDLLYQRIEDLSPMKKLGQGYSYVSDVLGGKISSISQVKTGDRLRLYVCDGVIDTRVEDKHQTQAVNPKTKGSRYETRRDSADRGENKAFAGKRG